jgi:hypothetical protein
MSAPEVNMRRWWLSQAVMAALLCAIVHADSPLTSTDLASAYADLAIVREARASKRVQGPVVAFLVGTEPTDRKAAVVNALGWQTPGNADAFLRGVAAARGVPPEEVKLAQLTAADRFVLGYLLALENYAEPQALRPGALDVWGATPMQLLDQAATALPDDFAVQYVRALAEAQRAMSDSFCSAYLATARVIEKFPARRRNLRPAAVAAAQSYMDGYKTDCAAAPTTAPDDRKPAPLNPEHDQIYSLARLGDTIVAGTQAGIVVWDPERSRPVANRDEQICASVVTWRDAVWAGCYGRVVRWDGRTWKAYLQDPARSESAFVPFTGPAGELLVRYGAEVWRYDSARDGFAATPMDLGKEAHHVLVRRNKDLWQVDFTGKITGPSGVYELGSDKYPGDDPRAVVEDATGKLWVMDFKAGAFRLNESTGRFERDGALQEKATTVAVDPARGRTWLLHYTTGPVFREGNGVESGARRPVELRELQYMRDMLLDERTGDLWVAGWTGLVRLREDKGRWKKDTWRVR